MLVRLMYASRAADAVGHDDLGAILKKSKVNNPALGITGVLCHADGIFLQVLEGGRSAVSALYNRITRDERHVDVVLLSFEEVCERNFAGWSMGQVDLSRVNAALLLKYSDKARLDPFSACGAASMALLHELVATASVVGQG